MFLQQHFPLCPKSTIGVRMWATRTDLQDPSSVLLRGITHVLPVDSQNLIPLHQAAVCLRNSTLHLSQSANRCYYDLSPLANLYTTSQVFITTGQSFHNQPGVHHNWPISIQPARCSSQLASLLQTGVHQPIFPQPARCSSQMASNLQTGVHQPIFPQPARCSSQLAGLYITSQVFITTGQSLYNQPGVHQTWCLPPKNTQEYQNIKQKNPKATTPQTLDTKQQKLRQNVQEHDYPIHKCRVKCVALQMSTYDIWYVNSHIILLADNGETKPLARPLHELHRKDIIQVLLSGLLVVTVHQYSYTGWCLSQDLNGTIMCCFSKILLVHLWTKQGQNYWLYSVSFF